MTHKIIEYIKSDAVVKTINIEKQSRHERNSSGYIPGRSYLFDGVDAQELVDRHHGTGEIRLTKSNQWKNQEIVDSDRYIGVDIDPETGVETITNRFAIHYSKTGTHVVPAERR